MMSGSFYCESFSIVHIIIMYTNNINAVAHWHLKVLVIIIFKIKVDSDGSASNRTALITYDNDCISKVDQNQNAYSIPVSMTLLTIF